MNNRTLLETRNAKRETLFVLLFCMAFSLGTVAQIAKRATGPSVTAAPIAAVTVRPGKSVPVEMSFRVAPGFHINSNHPKDEFLLPTQLTFDAPTDIVIAKLQYPQGKDYSFSFAPDQKLNVYSGDFSVRGMVTTTSTASKGTYRVHGTLMYQACDNASCYPPKKLPVAFDVHVVTGPRRSPAKNPAQSPHVH
jgi:DsbC/DsbD-like thiol-disulfide interchange protein